MTAAHWVCFQLAIILRNLEADLVGCFFYVLNITLRKKCKIHKNEHHPSEAHMKKK